MKVEDPIQSLGGPMARALAKLTQQTLQKMVVNLMEVELHDEAQHMEVLLTCITFLERRQKAQLLDFK